MRRSRYTFGVWCVLAVAIGAGACGDADTSDAGDQCPMVDPARLPAVNPPEEAARQGARQQELMGDAERIRQYGQAVPESFNDVWFDYRDDRWILVAGFKDRVGEHRAVLVDRVEHPDRLLVCRTAWSATDRLRITAELNALASGGDVFSSFSVGIERTTVLLRADQEALAKELYDKYRPTIDVTIGFFPYPPEKAASAAVTCPTIDAAAAPSGLRITAEPATTSFTSGTGPKTTVRIRNSSTTRYTGSQGNNYLVRAGTRTVVGTFSGGRDMMLRTFDVAPGGEGSFDDVFGTAPCSWAGNYTLPKGAYDVLPTVNVTGIGLVYGEATRVELA
jgi:hypothetical protein